MEKAIAKAIELAGSQSALARRLGITPSALGQQLQNGKILPKHCISIEKLFPGRIDRYELDPEHFGDGKTKSDCVVIVLQNLSSTSTTI